MPDNSKNSPLSAEGTLSAGLQIPEELCVRYKDSEQIARMPFVINDSVDCTGAYATLKSKAVNPDKDVFMGIAGLRSLDLLANIGRDSGRRYNKAVLFDNNITQIKAMNSLFVLIKESATPEQFIEKFTPHYLKWVTTMPRQDFEIKPPQKSQRIAMREKGLTPGRRTKEDVAYYAVHGATYPPRQEEETRAYFQQQMTKPDSWLHPDNFAVIKLMVENRQIDTILTELDDTKRFKKFSQWLTQKGLRVGDIYLSSSLGFMTPKDHYDYWGRVNSSALRRNTIANIKLIADNDTALLNSKGLGLAPGATSGLAPFVLHVENRDCDALKALSGADVANKDQSYNYAFNVGHATFTLRSPSREELDKALATPLLKQYTRVNSKWSELMTLFTCEVACPAYIPTDKVKTFLDQSGREIIKVIRSPTKYAGQELDGSGSGVKNTRVVFMIHNSFLKNSNLLEEMAKDIRKAITKGMSEGLQP